LFSFRIISEHFKDCNIKRAIPEYLFFPSHYFPEKFSGTKCRLLPHFSPINVRVEKMEALEQEALELS
jgi:hypothetical protein